MTRRYTILGIVLAFIIGLSLTTAYGNQGVPSSISDLDDAFTGLEAFLTDVSNEVNQNMIDIISLQGNQTVIFSSLTTINSGITNLQGNQTIILSSLSTINSDISSLQGSVATIESNITSVIISLNAEIVRIDSLNSIQIAERSEQDGVQVNVTALQADFDIVMLEVDSVMISLNTTMRDHSAAFHAGTGNGTNTIVVSHKAFENTNVTITFQYLEGSRQFGNGTERSFQLLDEAILLDDSKIYIETFIVPLGVLFTGIEGIVESCVILPTEDPNVCARTTSIEPGEELKVFFKVDQGNFITGLNSNIIKTRITTVITT